MSLVCLLRPQLMQDQAWILRGWMRLCLLASNLRVTVSREQSNASRVARGVSAWFKHYALPLFLSPSRYQDQARSNEDSKMLLQARIHPLYCTPLPQGSWSRQKEDHSKTQYFGSQASAAGFVLITSSPTSRATCPTWLRSLHWLQVPFNFFRPFVGFGRSDQSRWY